MAADKSYYYGTEVEWKNDKILKITGEKLPAIDSGPPPEFNGREGVWSPEHLFVASLNSCYTLTLLAILEFSKIPVLSLSSAAEGKLEKVEGGRRQITEIVVKPRLVIASSSDLVRIPRILEKAKENCFVSNSVTSAIKIEPEVFHHQTPAAPCPVGTGPDPAD